MTLFDLCILDLLDTLNSIGPVIGLNYRMSSSPLSGLWSCSGIGVEEV